MPLIPIILWVIALLGLGGIAAAIRLIARRLSGKRVAILGHEKVGKTTLLQILRKNRTSGPATRTVDPDEGGTFSMEIGRKTVNFHVPQDLPGHTPLGQADWKEAFFEANYIWYLFRSDLIAQEDPETIQIVKRHFDLFKDWIETKKTKDPKIILIGTWADKDPRYQKDLATFKRVVGAVGPIKVGLVKLGNTGFVVGSLLTDRNSKKLIKSLGRQL